MIIKNGKIFDESGQFHEGVVVVENGKIKAVVYGDAIEEICRDEEVIDADGLYVVPGFVDIHFHGCVGYDFCDGTEEAFDAITKYQAENGVTGISPATMTLSREELTRIFTEAGTYKNHTGSTIRGITMEGPFVSKAKKGAQNGAYIHKPDVDFYREMQALCGNLIKQVAVAPEEDEDFAFIKEISQETVISVAHTMADYDTAKTAFECGATHVTHLFNAMLPFVHRDPAVVGAAFDKKDVYVELICDGIHIHPSMVRAMFGLFGPERICMISDSMMATGMPDGEYSLGGQAVNVVGKKATLADGTIAGSASNLYDCFKTAVLDMGIPLESAVMASTITPAKSLGFDKECGSICEGKAADFVLLDQDLNIKYVIKDGKLIR
ncbi:MAG: N-acetylglucosamine-6-phosphate deacetylase [Lachnospiraceae bacterium]|nr:N-acetylglucosamine-6-phosphate deacetylase [Lachnospiraceae bacterium]